MTNSEKEVAFRKRRRDYTISKPRNAIRAGTTIVRIKEPRFWRPETILANTRAIKADKRKFEVNSQRKASANFPQPPESMAVALVIRLSKKNDSLSPQSRAVLAELRLAEQFDGVLVPLTEDMRHKLRCISHLIAYGLPSPEVVRQLIHTRARTVADGSELLITGNKAIRDALGEFDIEGLSDIVHAISGGAGPDALAEICAFLAPFHFNPKEIQGARLPVYAGGPSGFRGEHIDAFVESIL